MAVTTRKRKAKAAPSAAKPKKAKAAAKKGDAATKGEEEAPPVTDEHVAAAEALKALAGGSVAGASSVVCVDKFAIASFACTSHIHAPYSPSNTHPRTAADPSTDAVDGSGTKEESGNKIAEPAAEPANAAEAEAEGEGGNQGEKVQVQPSPEDRAPADEPSPSPPKPDPAEVSAAPAVDADASKAEEEEKQPSEDVESAAGKAPEEPSSEPNPDNAVGETTAAPEPSVPAETAELPVTEPKKEEPAVKTETPSPQDPPVSAAPTPGPAAKAEPEIKPEPEAAPAPAPAQPAAAAPQSKPDATPKAQPDVKPAPAPAPAAPSAGAILTETGELSPLYVGRIIGKGGEMIRDLEARSGCRIDVDQNTPTGAPKVVTYRGTRSEIDFAIQLVGLLCAGEKGADVDLPLGKASQRKIYVPGHEVSRIIGSGGSMIRKLQGESKARIQVDHSTGGMDANQRLVTMTGGKSAVAKAEEMINLLVANPGVDSVHALEMMMRGGGPPPQDPYYQNQGHPGAGYYGNPGGGPPQYGNQGAGAQYGRGSYGGAGGRETDVFPCAKTYMGRVIGQRGVTINDLQKRSGCSIQANQNVPAGQDCQIEISGPREGIEMVKQMLNDIITMGPNHPYAGGRE